MGWIYLGWMTGIDPGKDPDAGKDWGQEEKGATEDEMFEWHWLNGPKSEQTQRDGEGQRSLVCCSPWGRRVGHNLAIEQQPILQLKKERWKEQKKERKKDSITK